jgi:hypothetical protein
MRSHLAVMAVAAAQTRRNTAVQAQRSGDPGSKPYASTQHGSGCREFASESLSCSPLGLDDTFFCL